MEAEHAEKKTVNVHIRIGADGRTCAATADEINEGHDLSDVVDDDDGHFDFIVAVTMPVPKAPQIEPSAHIELTAPLSAETPPVSAVVQVA
ncbi:MAG: hypothetical protein ACOYLQ_09650 [Hyphomicrobiaceae bacterium]